jgi:hypothetical protein
MIGLIHITQYIYRTHSYIVILMKKHTLILLIVLLGIHIPASAKMLDMNLSEAINKKMVKMDAVNTSGRYVGKTTKLSVTNMSESALHLKVDLGMILKPSDSAYQPLGAGR